MIRFCHTFHAVATGLFLASLPLFGQLSPTAPWQKAKTDFLNLYQGSSSKKLKPEIVMVIDKSGSTSRLMFHKLFPNNWMDEDQPNTPKGSVDYTLVIANSSWPSTGSLNSSLSVGFGTSYRDSTPNDYISASGCQYYIGGSRGTVKVGTNTYPYNTLIKPDGSEVTASDVTSAGGRTGNAVDWMRCASHVRLRLTKIVDAKGTTTTLSVPRDIDFPLFWAPIDPDATLSSTDRGLTRARATDPKAKTLVDFETCTDTTNPPWNDTSSNSYVNIFGGTQQTSLVCSIRSRYIEWVFTGKYSQPETGTYYCIPNAIPTDNADKSVMRAIDPNSIQYRRSLPPKSPDYKEPLDSYCWKYLDEHSTPKNLSKGWWTAFDNGLPNRTRLQAIKESVIKSWLNHQDSIMFAYRFLHDSGKTPNNAIDTYNDSNWNYINSKSDLAAIAKIQPTGGTPLIESLMNTYCQFTNPDAFSSQIATEGYSTEQLECLHHFVILMTDGAPSQIPESSEGLCSHPYAQTSPPSGCKGYTAGSCPAYSGNNAIKADNSLVTSTYWNAPTLAGIAAHGGEGSSTNPTWIKDPKTETLSGGLSNWLPFWVTKRTQNSKTVTLSSPQPIQTMTVAVSLGVNFLQSDGKDWDPDKGTPTVATEVKAIQNDITGSKYRLLGAAFFGDPKNASYDMSTAGPFYLPPSDPNVPDIKPAKPKDAAYFFDGCDPEKLVTHLNLAFDEIDALSSTNTTAAPVFPSIGGGLGAEVYISSFLPPATSGPLWTGDLMMFPTKDTTGGTVLIDNTGKPITGNLEKATPQWSAKNALIAKGWTNRVIYSRAQANTNNPYPSMIRINLGSNGTNTSDAGFTAISSLLPGTKKSVKLKNWQFFAGADIGSTSTPIGTRSDTLMGDIINSSPAVLEYSTLPTSLSGNATLKTAWDAHSSDSRRFRVIFAGTNHGFFHAFGEVSWTDRTTNPSVPITQGVVDELWAFAPTDLLPNIDQLNVSSNTHRFAVDGPVTVYLLDRPQASNQTLGNGKYDVNAPPTNKERAVVIFGLGKGGRSYYAINIEDPANPALQWTLCPDESASYPSTRNKTTASLSLIANMGLSTCTPTIARVSTARKDPAKPNLIVDAVLLGGGYSDRNIEAALTGSPLPAKNTKLGRSALAIDTYTGVILGLWDISGTANAGPVASGIVPHEYAEGSGLHQRAYFTDYYGGLWALGSTTKQSAPNTDFRLDSSKVDDWTVRSVYRQDAISGSSKIAGDGAITTLPVSFNLPFFPVVRTLAPKVSPGAVGIAFVTGDRNNPLDDMEFSAWSKPNQHRLNVLFDRQDIHTPFSASDLADARDTSFNTERASSDYYLKKYYGYYINFPARSGGTFTAKGIVPPLVVDQVLFYSYFSPSIATCTGGNGTTDTFRVCDVMAPTTNNSKYWNEKDANLATAIHGKKCGRVISWMGVASTMAVRSVLAGVQAGITHSGDSGGGDLRLQDLPVQGSNQYVKVRVWRTVR